MSKRPNLADVAAAAGSTRRQHAPAPEPPHGLEEEQGKAATTPKPRTRTGTKQVAGHFPAEVAWQLRELAVDQRSTVQELLAEALNDLFQKYGKPELAPLSGRTGSDSERVSHV
jgi:hypothetical protein